MRPNSGVAHYPRRSSELPRRPRIVFSKVLEVSAKGLEASREEGPRSALEAILKTTPQNRLFGVSASRVHSYCVAKVAFGAHRGAQCGGRPSSDTVEMLIEGFGQRSGP